MERPQPVQWGDADESPVFDTQMATLGRSADEDIQMLEDLRMPIGALSAAI